MDNCDNGLPESNLPLYTVAETRYFRVHAVSAQHAELIYALQGTVVDRDQPHAVIED